MAPAKTSNGSKNPQGASRAWEGLTPALSEWILEAVGTMGFDRMTPVQASTIPLFTGNKDVVVEAVTGSGKTLSFLIPVIEKLLRLSEPIRKHHIGAIIISPTRELATQIHSVLLSLLAFHPPSAAHLEPETTDLEDGIPPPSIFPSSTLKVVPQLLLGGTTPPSQDLAHFLTNSPNLLISTPGRLLELLSSPHVHCPQSSFEVLVLDEADRLLDLGFKADLQKILQRLPKQRRTGLFSASVSEAVDQLVRVGLRNPVRIAVKVRGRDGKEDQRTPASLQMTYLTLPPTGKLTSLLTLLTHLSPQPTKSIAYLSTCAAVDYFSHLLPSLLSLVTNSPLTIILLHGRLSSTHRTKNFHAFLTSTTPTLLLTTDLAARGLDIPQVDLTIQLDPPSDPKTFLHRAGRAGRAGRKGLAVVFLLSGRESEGYPPFLEVRKTPVLPLSSLTTSSPENTHAIPYQGIPAVLSAAHDSELAAKFSARIRQTVLKDRQLYDKAQRAFVSWVRSYSKHAASSIFRVAELEWMQEAEAWGLLRLPRMPELKASNGRKKVEKMGEGGEEVGVDGEGSDAGGGTESVGIDRTLGLTVDWDNFRYKDVQAERKRKADVEEARLNPVVHAAGGRKRKKETAWSSKQAQKDVAVERREKKAKKRAKTKWQRMSEGERDGQRELESMIGKVRETAMRKEAKDAMEKKEEGSVKGGVPKLGGGTERAR